MADLVPPDQIRSMSFRTTFRGFNQAEVAEFLDRVARTIESLDAERTRLALTAGEQVDGDLQSEFRRVSVEIGEILEAARQAADGMRERAAGEVAEWRRSAEEDAGKIRTEAQADAEALRGDAWSTSKAMLDQSSAEARKVKETAEKEALAIVGQAERDSHRSHASARREADEAVRTAKMESERLLVDAHAQHDEIIETARKEADAAQERARALEVRRDELLGELEAVRSKIHVMEADIEERRNPIPVDRVQPASVRLIPAEASPDATKPAAAGWSPSDAIRIIPAASKKIEPDQTVDASSLADEVRRLRDDAALAKLTRKTSFEQVEVDDVTAAEESVIQADPPVGAVDDESKTPSKDEPEDALDDEPQPAMEVEPKVETEDPTAKDAPPPAKPWALDSLFATLRNEPAAPVAAEEYPPEPEVVVAPPAEPVVESRVVEAALSGGDPIAERDQLLLPITNRVLRSVKRQLTEAQNLTLEDVRVEGAWDPASVDLVDRVRGDLLVVVQESYAAGQAATGLALGADVGRPKPAKDDVPDHSEEFTSALIEALMHVAESSGEQGPKALAASLSRVYRAWRTDEAERRLRNYAMRAYHRGVLAGAKKAGVSRIRWIVAGRGCTTCQAAGKVGAVAIDSDFPGIDGVPPVHPGCACAIVPG
ncbi:MAG: DivIVA domain-containing protein [Acidimicrobiia bacterium]|nr:DivIVA domain-containing protein [Acidimicrobiia bacterium]